MLNQHRFSGITIMDLISRRRFGAFVKGKVVLSAHGGMARAAVGCRTVGRVAAAQSAQDGLPRRMLEAEGASSAAVLAFLGDIEQAGLELHSFMLSRGGAVVALSASARPYDPFADQERGRERRRAGDGRRSVGLGRQGSVLFFRNTFPPTPDLI